MKKKSWLNELNRRFERGKLKKERKNNEFENRAKESIQFEEHRKEGLKKWRALQWPVGQYKVV